MNFSEPKLIAKYKTWTRVQVAFYDFLFTNGTQMCARHFNEEMDRALKSGGGFANGADFYEATVQKIAETFPTPDAAWNAFLKAERV